MRKEIIYVGDPLCGWCYGFTNVFEKVIEKYQDIAKITIVMGGLKVEESIHINKKIKNLIYKNWTTVMDKTGQTFAVDLIDKLPEGKYNSEPPCRAVVTMRNLKQEATFHYYKELHTAMYRMAKNNTDPALFSEIAQRHSITKEAFNKSYNSDTMKIKTQMDFDFSKSSGVLGFPAFILKDEGGTFVLNQGYKPYEMIEKGIDGWLKGEKTILI